MVVGSNDLEDLLKRGADSLQRTVLADGGDWFDQLVAKARARVNAEGADPAPLPTGTRGAIIGALDSLEGHKQDVLHLGAYGLTALLAQIALGRTNEAVLVYLRETATLEELLAASQASNEDLARRTAERKAAVAKAIEVIKTIGSLTARYALPALLAAL